MLGWMVWTVPTAIFFVVIAVILAAMTVWQVVAPSAADFCRFRRPQAIGYSSACWLLRISIWPGSD